MPTLTRLPSGSERVHSAARDRSMLTSKLKGHRALLTAAKSNLSATWQMRRRKSSGAPEFALSLEAFGLKPLSPGTSTAYTMTFLRHKHIVSGQDLS